jgi:hypothetical protein
MGARRVGSPARIGSHLSGLRGDDGQIRQWLDPVEEYLFAYEFLARDESRSALESPFDEFLKRPYSVVPTDAYDDLGLHVYFDDALMVVGVEFLKWAQFTWRGQRLAGEEVLFVQPFLTG